MKKLIKPASLLFNLLCFLVFFLLGLFFAGWIEAGKNQGLAAGAVVLGWGIMFAGVAFIVSFFLTYHLIHRKIVVGNWALLTCLLLAYGITHYRYVQREKLKEQKDLPYRNKPTIPSRDAEQMGILTSFESSMSQAQTRESNPGMGFFSPNFFDNPALYFYNRPNLEKSILEHMADDSITFRKNKHNQFEIATAPSWLVPEILKMDYDIIYFKIKSVTEEFAEVIVNVQNGQTSYVSKQAGKVIYWPEFLLRVNSVEFLPDTNEKIKVRPFQDAGNVQSPYEFMRPIKINGEWAEVLLLNGHFQKVGEGWIQWRKSNKLLIRFDLFS